MSEYKEIIVKEYHNEKGLITRREIGEEIVRCKDCKWYDWVDCNNPVVTAFPNSVRDEDNYCNFGERKDGEE